MDFTQKVKDYVKNTCKMDLVGVAAASDLANAQKGFEPEAILPGASSVLVFARRFSDGAVQAAFCALEDGNLWAQSVFATYASDLLPNMQLFFMQFNICEYLERNFDCTAVPIPSGPMQNVTPVNRALPIQHGPVKREVLLDIDRAAAAAGLGQFAWNNTVVTPQFGPRQQFGAVLTTAQLRPDPPYGGPRLCDPSKCQVCSAQCPTHAIPSHKESGALRRARGADSCQVADIDANACAVASMAFRREFSGRAEVPDLIASDHPSDQELAQAYAAKPISHTGLDHYPKYFCSRCILYCPLGNWKERFADTGLSNFQAEGAST